MKNKLTDTVPTRWGVVSLALFAAGVLLGGCATVRTFRADRAELEEYRDKVIPACETIVTRLHSCESRVSFDEVRTKLCDDLNTALSESNALLRAKAPAPKAKRHAPAKEYRGTSRATPS